MKKARADILVVEDDPSILQGLLDVLVFNGYRAEGVEDGGEGLDRAVSGQFDLIILDVMLPTMDGFTICRNVRRQKPGQAIVMLTAKGAEEDIVKGFKAGADDYVSKPFSLRELMVRLEALLRRVGKNPGDREIMLGGIRFSGKTLTAARGKQSVALTRREMDLIVYFHRFSDRIVSKKELLVEVWNYADTDIETRTVDIHVLKLRKKIETLAPGTDLIKTIRGQGYRLEPEDEET